METDDAFHSDAPLRRDHKDKLLFTHQIANRLGIKERTVRYWAEVGDLPAFKLGGRWVIWESTLTAWLDTKEEMQPQVVRNNRQDRQLR